MSYSTPGPLRQIDRFARLEVSGDLPEGGYAGAGARGVAPAEVPASESEVLGFGMKLFLASLTMIFGATFAAYGIIWWRSRDEWQGAVDSGEVMRLAAATVLLVVADIAAARAVPQGGRPDSRVQAHPADAHHGLDLPRRPELQLDPPDRPGGPRRGRDAAHGGVPLSHAHDRSRRSRARRRGWRTGSCSHASTGGRGPLAGSLQMLYQYWRFLTVHVGRRPRAPLRYVASRRGGPSGRPADSRTWPCSRGDSPAGPREARPSAWGRPPGARRESSPARPTVEPRGPRRRAVVRHPGARPGRWRPPLPCPGLRASQVLGPQLSAQVAAVARRQ